jgi:hypothetical protein
VGGVRADALARALVGARTRLRAWRMYATHSAAAAARATTREEKSRAEACYRGAGPSAVRVDAADMLPNRDPGASRAVCCCLELPWAISVGLAATLYTVPACGCFSLCP